MCCLKFRVLRELSFGVFVNKIHKASIFQPVFFARSINIFGEMVHYWGPVSQSVGRVRNKIVPYTVSYISESFQEEVVFPVQADFRPPPQSIRKLCSCGSGYPKKISSNFALLQPRD